MTDATPSTSRAHAQPNVSMPGLIEVNVPSPAAYVTCGGGGLGSPQSGLRTIRHKRALREMEIEQAVNYGSEDDSDGDEDLGEEDFGVPTLVPRAQRMFCDDIEESATPVFVPESESQGQASPSLGRVEPSDLFKFEWKPFFNPPVSPTERREVFSDINCGPTAPYLTPHDAFVALWDREFMEYISSETNRYAQEVAEKRYHEVSLGPSSIIHWQDTNADELYVFLGLVLATGVCVKTDLTEYWTKGTSCLHRTLGNICHITVSSFCPAVSILIGILQIFPPFPVPKPNSTKLLPL